MGDVMTAMLLTRETLVILPLVPFCFIPVFQDAKSSPGRLILKVLIACAGMEAAMFLVYLAIPPGTAAPINMLLCVCGFFYLYQREVALPKWRLWFLFFTACLLGSFSFLFYHLVDIYMYPDAKWMEPVDMEGLWIQIGFEIAAVAILYYPARKYLGWLVHNFQEERVWRVIWTLPAGFMLFAYYFVPYDNSLMYMGRFLEMYEWSLVVLLILIFFIYSMFYKIAYSIVEKQEMIRKEGYLEMQAEQYHSLLAHVEETSRLRHDFRHQLTVIGQMVGNREHAQLEKYLEEYVSSISEKRVRYCASAAVNAVLNHYAMLCEELGIQARFSIRLQESFAVADIDFCVILGNLLENAVDECRNLPEEKREIQLKVGQTAECAIALQIANPSRTFPRLEAGRILSSKHGGEGQGLKSVRMTAEKYNGSMEAGLCGDVFQVRVLLNF